MCADARGATRARPRAPIRVLVVDDHRLVTDAIERLLAHEDDLAIVGTIGSLAEMREIGPAPDVILMDYQLTDGTGAEATRIAKARWPRARVLMLTAARAEERMLEAVQAGADGYLTKDRVVAEVAAAVRAASAGEVLLPRAAMASIAQRLTRTPKPTTSQLAPLTARELEVLRELTRGRGRQAIAADLGLSVDTVRTHIQAIRRKLHARSQLEAVAIALDRHIFDSGRSS